MSDTSADLYRTMNAGFVQAMYEQYLRDPSSVDAEWKDLFENGGRGLEPFAEQPGIGNRQSSIADAPASGPAPAIPDSRLPIAGLSGTPTPMKGAAARLVANMEASLG